MIFNVHELNPTLTPWIESVFHFKHFMPDHSIERVVPTGHVFILMELDGQVRQTFGPDHLEPISEFTGAWISGAHQHHLTISAHQDSEMCVVQFKPFGAQPFVHCPVDKLSNRVLPSESVFGSALMDLRQSVLPLASSVAKFDLIEAWLLNRLDTQRIPPEPLCTLVSELQKAPATKVNALLDQYPTTQKHLIDQFRQFVGMTPKQYQRIVRFNHLLQCLHQQQTINWSDIAYQCGYSDQSHFIREFSHFSGMKPAQFVNDKHHRGEVNFFALDANDDPAPESG